MLLQGLVQIQCVNWLGESNSRERPLRSYVLSKKANDGYYLCVKNSKYPNSIQYKLTDLITLRSRFVNEGKLSFEFRQPRHTMLFKGDDVNMVLLFLKQIHKMLKKEDVKVSGQQMPKAAPKKKFCPFDPMSFEHKAVGRFDRRILNMKHLSTLVLEGCTLLPLPVELGDLPIKYLSLSLSNISFLPPNSIPFWNWMCGDTIGDTLITLKMDSINLKLLPFEIMFLKNLQTLSVAGNSLKFLPHFIGELKKLKNLCVSQNLLEYFPGSLRNITFNELDISNNVHLPTESNIFVSIRGDFKKIDNIHNYKLHQQNQSNLDFDIARSAQKLSSLSFCSLMQNKIKFKRQDIPRTLWDLYQVVARCVLCHKFITPEYCILVYTIETPIACNFIKSQSVSRLSWQSIKCSRYCHLTR